MQPISFSNNSIPNSPVDRNENLPALDARIASAVQGQKRALEESPPPAKIPRVNSAESVSESRNGPEALWLAASRFDWPTVEKLLREEGIANVNAAPASGPSAGISVLFILAAHKQWELLRFIIENYPSKDVDVNAGPTQGYYKGTSVLYILAAEGQTELVRHIITSYPLERINLRAGFEEGEHKGKSILHKLALQDQWDLVEFIFSHYTPDMIDINAGPVISSTGTVSLLMMAAFAHRWSIVERILENFTDVDVNLTSVEGKNILLLAAKENQWPIFRLLFQNSSKATLDNLPREIRDAILLHAVNDGQLDILNAFSQTKEQQRAPNAATPQKEPVRPLPSTAKVISSAPIVGAGSHPVLSLALKGEWKTVRKLLDNPDAIDIGALVTEGEFEGANLIWFAAFKNEWSTVQQILQHYVHFDINATPKDPSFAKSTVIWLAASKMKWQIVRSIRKYQPVADLNIWPEGQFNPTLLAAAANQFDIVEKIIDELKRNVIDFRSINQTINGVNIVWCLALNESWARVASLIEKFPSLDGNVQPTQGPNRGKTLAWILAMHKDWDLLKRLFTSNTKVNLYARPLEGPDRDKTLFSLILNGPSHLVALLGQLVTANDSYFEFLGDWYVDRARDGASFAELFGSYRFPELVEGDPLPNEVARSLAEFTFSKTTARLAKPYTVDTFVQKKLRDRMVLIASRATAERGLSEENRRELFKTIFSHLKAFRGQTDYPKVVRDRVIEKLREPGIEIFDAISAALNL